MATDDEVRIKLTLKGAAAFVRDAARSSEAIKRIGDQARRTDRFIRELGRSMNGLNGDTRRYNQAARSAEAAMRRMERQAASMRRELDRVRAAQNRVGGASRNAAQGHSRLATSLASVRSMASGAATALAAVGTAGAAAAGAGAYNGIKLAGSMEQTEIGFKTMLGSSEAATAKIAELQTFAATTPFNFKSLTETSQRMLAMGFGADELIPSLTSVGDAIAAMGGADADQKIYNVTRALGQMRTAGRVNAEDMNQLTDAGINGWQYLADAAGTSMENIRRYVDSGQDISGKWASNVLLQGMGNDPRFKGAAAAQSRTFLGTISNLKDSMQAGAAKGFRPLTDELTKHIPSATKVSEKAFGVLGRTMVKGIGQFRKAVPTIKEFAGAFRLGGMDLLVNQIDNKMGANGGLVSFYEGVKTAGKGLADFVMNVAWPIIKKLGPTVLTVVGKAFSVIGKVLTAVGYIMPVLEPALMGVKGILTFIEDSLNVVLSLFGKIESAANWLGIGGPTKSAPVGSPLNPAPAANPFTPRAAANPFAPRPTGPGLPGMANGGVVRRPGLSWVGERGPELLSMPRGAQVQPLDQSTTTIKSRGDVIVHPGGIVVQGASYADGQKLAKIIVKQLQDKVART